MPTTAPFRPALFHPAPSHRPPPHVHILMCTYNGARHLQAQLDSFLAQDHTAWSLWVSDDNSHDATGDILAGFQAAHPTRDIRILKGPCQGHAANFLTLLAHPDLPAEATVALSDQDDVWLPHKLSRALSQIAQHSRDQGAKPTPLVYSSRCFRVTADLAPLDRAPLPRRGPSFANALVQNILSGNCIVLPPTALALLRQSLRLTGQTQTGQALTEQTLTSQTRPVALRVPFHDWWIYQVMAGAGARMIIDAKPGVLYRQHDSNVLGAPQGSSAARARWKMIQNRDYATWIGHNLGALSQASALLTPDNQRLVAQTRAALDGPAGLRRLYALRRLGLHRQTRVGSFILYSLTLFRRL